MPKHGSDSASIVYSSRRIALIAVPVVLLLLAACYKYFNPPYNFLWGDYETIYDKRKSRGRFLFVGIVLAIMTSIVATYISRIIGI
jgi:hypothetical protein